MPRRPRLMLPDTPLHIIQRGNNRQACFFADEDYHFYLDWLGEYAGKSGCRIHAYVLMNNHVHLLLSAERAEGAGALMKALGQRYVQQRSGCRSGDLRGGKNARRGRAEPWGSIIVRPPCGHFSPFLPVDRGKANLR